MNESRNIVRMMEPAVRTIGSNTFYIYPLPAFDAANLSGEVFSVMVPILSSMLSAVGGSSGLQNMADMEISEMAPHIVGAFSSISGDKVESLLKKLLLGGNVGVLQEGRSEALILNEDLSNEVFCGNIQDMFILAFYVMKENYKDFLSRYGILFGKAEAAAKKMGFPGMGPLT